MIDPEHTSLWQEAIIEHSHFPRGHHEVDPRTHEGSGDNPLCGDRVSVQVRLNREGVIEDIGCLSVGCAISIASASMLAEVIQDRKPEQALELFAQVRAMLLGDPADGLPGDLAALQLVRQYPSRVKCATLAWHALNHALRGEARTANTEQST